MATADNLTDEQIRPEWGSSLRSSGTMRLHRATIVALEMAGPEDEGAIRAARSVIADAFNGRAKAVR